MDDLNSNSPMGADYDTAMRQWLERASEQWTSLDMSDLTATETSSLTRLVLSGQVQLRIQLVARGASADPSVHATCVVTGDYKQAIVRSVRGSVPEFGERVVIHPPSKLDYRLSSAGVTTKSETREFGGGSLKKRFLAESLQFAVPGVVNIIALHYATPSPTPERIESPPTPEAAHHESNNQSKTPAWPVSRTEGYVSAYCQARHTRFVELARDVLDDRDGAEKELKAEFGPTAIARHINGKVDTDLQRACRAQDVLKTQTYRQIVKPLMQNPPRKPAKWNEMISGREGDDLPDILDEIPFEDDEL